jgi:putative ABC transport system permease protein
MRHTHLASVAWKNLLINRRRTLLTMLGLIIGVLSVILVMSVGAGAQSLITNQIQKRGTDQIAVLSGAAEEDGPPAAALGIVVTTLTADDGKALLDKKNVSHVKEVTGYLSGNDILRWQHVERNVTYTGTDASYAVQEQVTVSNGRFFDETDVEGKNNVMVLGDEISRELFGNQEPIGQLVKLKRKNFKVIGVLKPKGSTGFENPDNAVLIPLTVAQQSLLGVKHVSILRIRVDDEAYLRQSVEEIKQTLIDRHGDEDFSVRTVADLLSVLTTITNVLKFFLVAIASVSLFVGGVGIMNIMLIAVKEKTKEIGLRKSVGAKNNDILIQFLIETVVISLVAGVIGILLGVGIAFLIAVIVQALDYDYSFIVSPASIIVAFGVAAGIGLLFGIVPAKKASELSPIDALRYE